MATEVMAAMVATEDLGAELFNQQLKMHLSSSMSLAQISKKTMNSISTPAELDTSTAGDAPSSSANSITYLATLMALLLLIIN